MKPILFNTAMVQAILDGRKTCTRRVAKGLKDATKVTHGDFKWDYKHAWMNDLGLEIAAPFHIGEILYVRETWQISNPMGDFARNNMTAEYMYKAGFAKGKRIPITQDKEKNLGVWKPSIHMPKDAARIFLKVTDVRVERLQDITEDGIRAEGITEEFPPIAKDNFKELWDSTTKEYRWRLNPYVWVISFERCEKPNE
ncbi:hypothetical protein U728_762 [Clostridium botulinum 202F]|nr:hypothetical protein U728_762 [Clostridium botulinum 202F]KON14715.1 hypothetical protein ACP50_00770 [Clostridium botulinum]NFH01689.1 hypothetical protein [Clostridium botulinum]NFP41033.1 hypothetical protein [Clostridium botulinum]NFQ58190.1 hypothetical protein [Clostridium botulinum]